jgi:hypothetical protein
MISFAVSQLQGKQTVQTTSRGKVTVGGFSELVLAVPEVYYVDIQPVHPDGTPWCMIPNAEKLALRFCENDDECYFDCDGNLVIGTSDY